MLVAGALMLAPTLARLVARAKTAHPPQALNGKTWADRLAPGFHCALYVLVLAWLYHQFVRRDRLLSRMA